VLQINIYTDGAARGNPGPGGYGVVLIANNHYKELSGGFRKTTNNRMELLAVIKALEAIKAVGASIQIYTDSKYVCDAITKGWVFNWQKIGFKDKKNADLWRQFLKLYPNFNLKLNWVKGHAGHIQNERCDVLATQAADDPTKLQIDAGFESGLFN